MEAPKIEAVQTLDVKENEPLVLPKIDEFVPAPAILSNKSKIPSDRPHPNWPYEEEDQKKRLGLLPMPVRMGSSTSVLSGKSNRAKLKSSNRSNIRMQGLDGNTDDDGLETSQRSNLTDENQKRIEEEQVLESLIK